MMGIRTAANHAVEAVYCCYIDMYGSLPVYGKYILQTMQICEYVEAVYSYYIVFTIVQFQCIGST